MNGLQSEHCSLGTHDALERCREYINEGYVYAVSMDLQSYFDTVNHSKLIEYCQKR